MVSFFNALGNGLDKVKRYNTVNLRWKFSLHQKKCKQPNSRDGHRLRVIVIVLTKKHSSALFRLCENFSLNLEDVRRARHLSFVFFDCARALLQEWNYLNMTGILASTAEETIPDRLEFRIEMLADIRISFPSRHSNEKLLQDKLLSPAEDSTWCQLP